MSHHPQQSLPKKMTAPGLQEAKSQGRKISMLTCYDSAFASLLEQTPLDAILVGDSMGNVILGDQNTLAVRIEDIIHHCRAVAKASSRPFLCADMPFLSFHISPEETLRNAGRLIAEGGAQGVKMEGAGDALPHISKVVGAGIPVVGHLGLTPQSVHAIGGHKVQGRGEAGEKLLADALKIEESGACMLVLELIPADLAAKVSQALQIPTIGIGAGPHCDGQVLVLHDMLGFQPSFSPKFLKKYANLAETVVGAVTEFDREVKLGEYPSAEHTHNK